MVTQLAKPSNSGSVISVIIIGAGLSGLTDAYELERAGVDVVIVDAAGRVGEPWRRNPQLHLNTHRLLSHLPGLRLPRGAGAFPARDAMVDHLDTFVHRLPVPIKFGVRVLRVERDGDRWALFTSADRYLARHVIVATGRDRCPYIPDWQGRDSFGGELIHAAQFGYADAYRGRRVLVVGAGNSGTELLNHLIRVPLSKLWISVRHGPVVLPTRILGIPLQLTSILLAPLPVPMVDRILNLTQRLVFGDLRRYGLPRHSDGAATRLLREGTTPAFDQGFVAGLKAGRAPLFRVSPTSMGTESDLWMAAA
jgi:cation diffusion facilitator CzcD-associated flavoprotein CzcO